MSGYEDDKLWREEIGQVLGVNRLYVKPYVPNLLLSYREGVYRVSLEGFRQSLKIL